VQEKTFPPLSVSIAPRYIVGSKESAYRESVSSRKIISCPRNEEEFTTKLTDTFMLVFWKYEKKKEIVAEKRYYIFSAKRWKMKDGRMECRTNEHWKIEH
jgi:hypothetical protein